MRELHRVTERIYEELQQLGAEVAGVRPLFEKLATRDPDEVELRAAALTLHGFYNGVEAVFLFIAKHFDHHVPDGIRWHRQLLDQMNTATDRRARVIDQQAYDMLLEYLSFRHMVRHTYPGMLDWDRFRDIARDLLSAHARVDQAVRRFVTAAPTDDK